MAEPQEVEFAIRENNEQGTLALVQAGYPDILARVLASRGATPEDLAAPLGDLLPWTSLKGAAEAAHILADAIENGLKLVIVADYDADGATACAVGMRALRALGAHVDFVVPDRITMGYGLTPPVVDLARQKKPDIIVTVDNGIASFSGIEAANAYGIPVIVTDHHLPGDSLPPALAIVNPNQPGCEFQSKAMAGVGVMFYTMLALRAEMRARGRFKDAQEPNFAKLLDLVALGTVADVVKLDSNNRLLVREGLKRIAAGQCQPGIKSLYAAAKKNHERAKSADLGFVIGPRLNAAGRMEGMGQGIECLITDDETLATDLAQRLDTLNRERRNVEEVMQEDAIDKILLPDLETSYTLSLYDESWHPGVIGIVASRLKDRFHRPTITFAQGIEKNEIRGSGRSIPGFHLRDALDWVTRKHPDLIQKFGGHAAAAGLTIKMDDLARFSKAFEDVAREWLTRDDLRLRINYDGDIPAEALSLPLAKAIQSQVWGQGFPEPLFGGRFTVIEQRSLGGKHLKLQLQKDGKNFEAILFGRGEYLPDQLQALFGLGVNEWNGSETLQLDIKHWRAAQEPAAISVVSKKVEPPKKDRWKAFANLPF